MDRGVDPNLIGANYESGWPHPSGSPGPGKAVGGHGAITARNVLAVASTARIWDIPLIPERITDKKTFLAEALVCYSLALAEIALNAGQQQFSGSWIFVNPLGLVRPQGGSPRGRLHEQSVAPVQCRDQCRKPLTPRCRLLGRELRPVLPRLALRPD